MTRGHLFTCARLGVLSPELILLPFFSLSGSSKSLAAVCFGEDGTERSDVNLKPVWF